MFENGELDSRPAMLPERLARPTLQEAIPGSAHWVDLSAVWVDGEQKVWINDNVPLNYNDDDFVQDFVRIIAFEEGFVLDITELKDHNGNTKQFTATPFSQHLVEEGFDIGEYQPVVAVISTAKELKEIKRLFKQRYGCKLNGQPSKARSTNESRESSKSKKKVD